MPTTPDGVHWGVANARDDVLSLYKELHYGPFSPSGLWTGYKEWILAGILLRLLWGVHTIRVTQLVRIRTEELRRTVEVLRETQADAARTQARLLGMEHAGIVSQLSAMFAHEVSQSITSLVSYATGLQQHLSARAEADPMVDEATSHILSQAKRVADIVDRVRRYAKQTERRHVEVAIADLLRHVENTFRHSEAATRVRLTIEERAFGILSCDPLEIELLLYNLLKNAAAALRDTPSADIRLKVEKTEDALLFSVTDNGPPVPNAVFEQLFHPTGLGSSTTGGLGLGLNLCRLLAEHHNGHLTFSRPLEGGLCVTVRLPQSGVASKGSTESEKTDEEAGS